MCTMCTVVHLKQYVSKRNMRRPLFGVLLRTIVANRLLSTDHVCVLIVLDIYHRAFYRKFPVEFYQQRNSETMVFIHGYLLNVKKTTITIA